MFFIMQTKTIPKKGRNDELFIEPPATMGSHIDACKQQAKIIPASGWTKPAKI